MSNPDTTAEPLAAEVARLRTQVALLADARIVCPAHGIPDCSPILNGCSIPNHVRSVIDGLLSEGANQ